MRGRRMGRPGLVGRAARTAGVAGTATAVSGNVSRRQQSKAQAQADGITGRVTLVIDAQRGEFYSGACEITDAGPVIAPLRIVSLMELRECAQKGDLLIGPEVSRWFPQGRDFFPCAATLGKLALSRNDFVTGAELKPVYLRTTAFVKATAPRILPEA